MTDNKKYAVGDIVWIAGVSRNNAKLTRGTVIKVLDLTPEGFSETQYLIGIPTEIETLLEVRTWGTMSSTDKGPLNFYHHIRENLAATLKVVNQVGFVADEDAVHDDPTPEQIHAAIEASLKNATHAPLSLRTNKSKPKFRPRKKKTNE